MFDGTDRKMWQLEGALEHICVATSPAADPARSMEPTYRAISSSVGHSPPSQIIIFRSDDVGEGISSAEFTNTAVLPLISQKDNCLLSLDDCWGPGYVLCEPL